MLALSQIFFRLSKHEELFQRLSYATLERFFETILRYMPRLVTSAPRRRQGLPKLATNVLDVLALNLHLSYEDVEKLWAVTGDLLLEEYKATEKLGEPLGLDDALKRTAPQFALGTHSLSVLFPH